MECNALSSDCLAPSEAAELRVTILYEDFASGVRAKHFAENLAGDLGSVCHLSESLWRLELLERPGIAGQAAKAAEHCDYLIIAVRGDHALVPAARRWIEAQLEGAADRGAALIALIGMDGTIRPAGDGARAYLHSLCAGKGLPFFCSMATPGREETGVPDPSPTLSCAALTAA